MKLPLVTYGLIAINLLISGVSVTSGPEILDWGANFAPYVLHDQWWRIISSAFLHGGLLHLLVNMLALFQIGRQLEPAVGSAYFMALYLLSAIGSGLLSVYWNLFTISVGASGAIFGLYGFEIVLLLVVNRKDPLQLWKVLFNFFLFITIIFVAGQYLPFDNAGHFGGMFTGIALAVLFVLFPFRKSTQLLKFGAAALVMVLIYLAIPRYQVQYFETFQEFIKAEDQFSAVFEAEDDSLALSRLRGLRGLLDTVQTGLDSLPTDIPDELQADLAEVQRAVQKRKEETRFYITLLERESYIYYDSIEWAQTVYRQRQPLKYNLRMEANASPEEEVSEPSKNLVVVEQFYDKDWKKCDITNAKYYRRGYKDSLGRWDGPVRDYYLDGGIQMKGEYKADLKDGVFIYYSKDSLYESAGRYREEWKIGKWEYFSKSGHLQDEIRFRDQGYLINHWSDSLELQVSKGEGAIREYHTNGVLAKYEYYTGGRKDSISYGYHPDGNIHFREYYDDGRLLHGVSYDIYGNKYQYDASAQMTYPENGLEAFWEYVEQERRDIMGDSLLGYQAELIFNITPEGEVFDIRVLSGDANSLNVIARVILKNGPKWIPVREHGIKPLPSEGLVKMSL